jgi:hypothetical protein
MKTLNFSGKLPNPFRKGYFSLACFVFFSTSFNFLTTNAQPVVSADPLPAFEIDARARNGNTGFEGVLFTPTTPAPGAPGGGQWQMDPAGAPVWNSNGNVYGNLHSFLLTYEKASGITAWNIDFNRDGDFTDPQEMVTNSDAPLAGKGFRYINLWVQGGNGLTATVTDFTINGHTMGSYVSASETAESILFKETQGLFGDLTISGQLSFSGNGSQERPRIWVRLGQAEDSVSQGSTSVPLFSDLSLVALLLLIVTMGGSFLYRFRSN